jgi:tetratricopeptide (TPR) repeat protein/predicted aspartyl protease
VKKLTRMFVLVCTLVWPLMPTSLRAECKREALDLPVTISGTRPLITAKINHQEVHFIVDSGAFFSMISSAAAQELKLPLGPAPFGLTITGVGGSVYPSVATAKVFTLANVDVPNVQFLVGGSEVRGGSIGVLGQNFLEMWDVEYDLAKGLVRLIKDTDCRKNFLAYWVAPDQPHTVIDIDRATPKAPHTVGSAYVNGQKIRVIFDTGAARSLLTLRAAERAGVKVDSPGVVDSGISTGIGQGMVKTYIAPFASFKFADGEEIKNARLRIADLNLGSADMLLGADFFLSHRVFVANSQHKLYFTYNGGPVFDLRTAKAASPPPTPDASANPADAQLSETKPQESDTRGAAEESDAAAIARRGTASAGRHDYDHAIADLTRATELEPNNPEYFYERGQVFWRKNEPQQAMVDFNRVLELNPDHVPALMGRAQLRINAKDISNARLDLDAIDKIAAKQADVRYDLAVAYERTDLLGPAIAQFDLWIAAHAEDSRLANALNGRCAARGRLGRDLPAALKDCNEAVSRSDKHNNAAVLDNRALVRFRLGDYDKSIGDYDAALKLQPRSAWTLYGRGLAKLKKNQRSEGEADIAQAVNIAPGVVDGYKRLDIAP